jgi:hypothetical protein
MLLQGFEPVMLVLAKDVSWYDERFRGPLGARTLHVLDMLQHLTLEVDPENFVINWPLAKEEVMRMGMSRNYDQVNDSCFK